MTRKIFKELAALTILAALTAGVALASQDDVQLRRNRPLVREVQQALLDKGYSPGPVDGMVGPQTRQALESFQQDQGLEASGRITDETLQRLGVEIPEYEAGDPERRGGVVGAVGSAGKAVGAATAKGATAAAKGTAAGATAAAKGTAAGATAAAKGTATGAEAAAEGATTGAKAAAGGATTGAKAAASGVETGASATAEGAKAVARGTSRVAGGAKNLLFGKDEDDKIRDRVAAAFKKDRSIDPSHFGIEVKDRIVTLTFKAGTSQEWNRAVAVARRVEGVDRVFVRRP